MASSPPTRRPLAPLGAVLGAALAFVDVLIFQVVGVDMRFGTTDVAWLVALTYALSFAALGWALGRLIETRRALTASAATIQAQLEALELSRRRAVENETLAAIGRMAAGVAHEVRNPLGVIRSSASLLMEGLAPSDPRRPAGEFVVAEVDRLNRFVGTLLDFSRPFTLERRPVDLVALAKGLAAPEAAGLPAVALEAPSAVSVEGDPDLLATAARSLVQNAAEAGGTGGRIAIRAGSSGEEAWLEVADDGPGVDEADEARLGEAFFTTKPRGTGLGLAMARRILQAHGGRLDYRRGRGVGEAGAGACFRLTLPRSGAAVEAA